MKQRQAAAALRARIRMAGSKICFGVARSLPRPIAKRLRAYAASVERRAIRGLLGDLVKADPKVAAIHETDAAAKRDVV